MNALKEGDNGDLERKREGKFMPTEGALSYLQNNALHKLLFNESRSQLEVRAIVTLPERSNGPSPV